jgi:hypothetical protein
MYLKYAMISGTILLVSNAGFAQSADNESSNGRTFTAEDFQQFSPSTSLDMVSRIPGFSI